MTNSVLRSVISSHWETAVDSIARLLRTPGSTLMTVLVIAIALLLPGLLGKFEGSLEPVAESFQDSTRITLFLLPEVSEQTGLGNNGFHRPPVSLLRPATRGCRGLADWSDAAQLTAGDFSAY